MIARVSKPVLAFLVALIIGGCVSAGGRGQIEFSLRPNVFVWGHSYYPHDHWYLHSPTSSYYRPYPPYFYGYGYYSPYYYFFCPSPQAPRRGCEKPPSPKNEKKSPQSQPEGSHDPAVSSPDERRFLFLYLIFNKYLVF